MSVLKNKRSISTEEYEHTFEVLYDYSSTQTEKVSRRRRKWICGAIELQMNKIFNLVVSISSEYFPPKTRKDDISKLASEAIEQLHSLQKPLFVMWNILQTPTKKMVKWCTLINSEIELLEGMVIGNVEKKRVFIIDYDFVGKAVFVSKMVELHRYMHSQIVKAPQKYAETRSALIMELIDDALYNVMRANFKIPTTASEYKLRRKYISTAISDLNKLQRPLTVYFTILNYSENVIAKVSQLLIGEIRLLHSINSSDKQRFSTLS